jgi:hypothetical protein
MGVIRRIGASCALLAALCLGFGFALSASAQAEQGSHVLLAVNGGGFTSTPPGPLLDTTSLAPGRSRAAQLGVRSAFGVGTKLTLDLFDVHDDDNGCTAAESVIDRTCGDGQGDLGPRLLITVDLATKPTGPYRTVWTGSADQLARSVTLDGAVPAKGERWLHLTAMVPAAVGNVVQSDSITFGVRVVLSGNGAHGGSDIAGEHTGQHAGSDSTSSHGTEGLAATGFSLVLFVVGAVSLLVAGTMMAFAGIGRRRPEPPIVQLSHR